MNAIEIHQLKKTYESGEEALKGIDLQIPKGSFYGLLGPNGAGKTTTIGILTGLINKTAGNAEIMGYDTVNQYKKARKLIGLSPQEINLDVFFTIREILIFQAGYYGINKKNAIENVDHYLDKLGLYNKRNSKARELSGGMKRRVQIAKALVHNPPIIILDEPTAGVDIELRHMLWDYLQKINEDGKTILLTTHYIEEAEKLCDNIAIINNGEIVKTDKTKNIINEASNNIIEIHVQNIDKINHKESQWIIDKKNSTISMKSKHIHEDITYIIKNIGKATEIKNVRIINSSLEDAFLKLTSKKDND